MKSLPQSLRLDLLNYQQILMQFTTIDRVIREEVLYERYMHSIVAKTREYQRLPCEVGPGRL